MGATWDTVRELALQLPEAVASTSRTGPAVRVEGVLFVRLLPDRRSVVVKVDVDDREWLLDNYPETFSVPRGHKGYPMLVVRLAHVDADMLRRLLTGSWRHSAPDRLIALYHQRLLS